MKLYDENICRQAEALVSKMSLREKIGQMVMFNGRNVKMLREKYSYKEIAEKYPFGSFFSGCDVIGLVGKRMKGVDDVNAINEYSKLPLIVAGDLENGGGGEPMPVQLVLGATHDLKLAYDFGRVIAQRGRSEGFHWTFAPVADIDFNWRNPITNTRTFGSDPAAVLPGEFKFRIGTQHVLEPCANDHVVIDDGNLDHEPTFPSAIPMPSSSCGRTWTRLSCRASARCLKTTHCSRSG